MRRERERERKIERESYDTVLLFELVETLEEEYRVRRIFYLSLKTVGENLRDDTFVFHEVIYVTSFM